MSTLELAAHLEVLARQELHCGLAAHEAGDLDAAELACEASLALYPTPEAHLLLARIHAERREPDAVAEQCRRAADLDPDSSEPFTELGACLLETGRPGEAVAWLQRARQAARCRGVERILCLLGRGFELLGRDHDAEEVYREILELEPDCDEAIDGIRRLRELRRQRN